MKMNNNSHAFSFAISGLLWTFCSLSLLGNAHAQLQCQSNVAPHSYVYSLMKDVCVTWESTWGGLGRRCARTEKRAVETVTTDRCVEWSYGIFGCCKKCSRYDEVPAPRYCSDRCGQDPLESIGHDSGVLYRWYWALEYDTCINRVAGDGWTGTCSASTVTDSNGNDAGWFYTCDGWDP